VLAEMTAHGVSAQRASQNEANAIRSLIAPTNTMTAEFGLLGISTDQVNQKMGTVGLSGTMQWLSTVAQKGAPAVGQTYTEAMKKLMGTAAGLNVALMTTGENAPATAAAIAGIGAAAADSSGNVQGFAEVQKTFKQQLADIDAGLDSLMIELGERLVPALSSFISLVQEKGSPVAHAFADDLRDVADGFEGIKQAMSDPMKMLSGAKEAIKPSPASLSSSYASTKSFGVLAPQAPISLGSIYASQAPKLPAPDISEWQRVGQELHSIFNDLINFGGQVVAIFENLQTAAEPLEQDLGVLLLGALKAVSVLLADYLGPALVAVSGFMAKHGDIVRDVVEALILWKAATLAQAAAQAILTAVLDADPVTLIVIAIGLLVTAFVICWQHSQTFRQIITDVFSAVATIVLTQIHLIIIVVKALADSVLEAAMAVTNALSEIPGPTQKAMKDATKAIGDFKNDTDAFFNGAITDIKSYQKSVAAMPQKIKLQGDITDLQNKLKTAQAQLATVPASKRTTLLSNIDNLRMGIRDAKAQLASIPAIVTSTLDFNEIVTGKAPSQYVSAPGHWMGGVVSGAATGGARGGLTWVGERGPELVRLPTGSTVFPAGQSAAMASSAATGQQQISLSFEGGDSAISQLFVKVIKEYVRVNGGNVQLAFGR
jgi:hypothetical protein